MAENDMITVVEETKNEQPERGVLGQVGGTALWAQRGPTPNAPHRGRGGIRVLEGVIATLRPQGPREASRPRRRQQSPPRKCKFVRRSEVRELVELSRNQKGSGQQERVVGVQ